MIIAASVIYFKSEHYDDLVLFLKEYSNIELHEKDIDEGKLVITIEAENNEDIENIEKACKTKDYIYDLAHFSFHFGDEVEKAEKSGVIPDFDITKPFTRKRIL